MTFLKTMQTQKQQGQSLTEYGLLALLVSIIALGGLQQIGVSVLNQSQNISNNVSNNLIVTGTGTTTTSGSGNEGSPNMDIEALSAITPGVNDGILNGASGDPSIMKNTQNDDIGMNNPMIGNDETTSP